MMSSCHREDQGERPPGVRNALFFPVVFRKVVINLIPPSSLPNLAGDKEGKESKRRRTCREQKRHGALSWSSRGNETNKKGEEKKRPWDALSCKDLFFLNFIRCE